MRRNWKAEFDVHRASLAQALDGPARRSACAGIHRYLEELGAALELPVTDVAERLLATKCYVYSMGLLVDLGQESLPAGLSVVDACARMEEVARKTQDQNLRCRAAWRLGKSLQAAERHADSRETVDDALHANPSPTPSRVLLLVLHSALEANASHLSAAYRDLEQASQVLEEHGQAWRRHAELQLTVLGRRVDLDLAMGRSDRAGPFIRQEEALSAQQPGAEWRLFALRHRLEYDLVLPRYDLLVKHAAEALEYCDAGEHLSTRARVQLTLGIGHAAVGNSDLALRSLLEPRDCEALPVADRLRAAAWRSEVFFRLQRLDEADAELRRAELFQAQLRGPGSEFALDLDGIFVLALKTKLALARDPGGPALARIHADILEAFEGMLAHWHSAPERQGGIGFLKNERRRDVISLLLEVELRVADNQTLGVARCLQTVYRVQSAGTSIGREWRRLAGAVGWPRMRPHEARWWADARELASLSSMEELAADRTRSLEFLQRLTRLLLRNADGTLIHIPGSSRGDIFIVDERGVARLPGPTIGELGALADPFKQKVQGRPSAEILNDQLREISAVSLPLREALFPAQLLQRAESWTSCAVVGHSLLNELPLGFLELPTRGDDPVRLGERYALSYLPSLPLGLALAERPREETRGALVVVGSRPDASLRTRGRDLADLQITAEQQRALTQPFRDREPLLIHTGVSATPHSLRRSSDVAITHVLCHGIQERSREVPAGLVLSRADDGRSVLWSEDVAALGGCSPIMLISACQAAKGNSRPGEDSGSNLSGRFLEIGARVVVTPPRNVSFQRQVEIMAHCCELLNQGASVAEAMRVARVRMSANPATRHPFYSMIQVVGLGSTRLARH